MLKDERVGRQEHNLVDAQAHDVHQRKLAKLGMHRALARFGKSPQAIPSKIAQDGARNRNQIRVLFCHSNAQHHQVEYTKVNHRADCADDGKFEKACKLAIVA